MLDKVKLALRLSGTALDGEVSDLINAAIADLRLVGINIPAEAGSSSKTLGDPLLDRAVVLYAKAEFGFNDDAERYRNAYDYLFQSTLPAGGATENAFKALFRHSETDTQLYSVCAVRLFDGTRVAAKWVQDSVSGAFRIVTTSGNVLGTQGGFRGHIPENCKKRDDGTWGLFPLDRTADRKQIIRVAF